jgi:type IV pilus biogenesis protein CpaD/CtpE
MIKTTQNIVFFSLALISLSLCAAHDPKQAAYIEEMINFQKCMRGLGKAEQCANSRSEQSILKDATANGTSANSFMHEVLHKAVLQQQPSVVVSALAVQATEEKAREDINMLVEHHDSNQKYWNMGTGAVSALAVLVGFAAGRFSSK